MVGPREGAQGLHVRGQWGTVCKGRSSLATPPWLPWSHGPGEHNNQALIRASGVARVLSLCFLSQPFLPLCLISPGI